MSIFQKYYLLPDVIKYVLVLLPFIYVCHFYIFYLWKPVKKKLLFWQIVLYSIIIIPGYYFYKHYFANNYQELFLNIYAKRIINIIWYPFLDLAFYSPVLIFIVFIIKNIYKRFFSTPTLKHGPKFTPTDTAVSDGIKVGNYNAEVLPLSARQFSKDLHTDLVIPYNRLSRTITIIGDQGCGKSRLMRGIADDICNHHPDIPLIIHDPKGEWLRTYYNPDKDLIFAPYDKRSCSWNIWDDFHNHPDLKNAIITTAVESHHSGSNVDKFWCDSAISLLEEAVNEESIEDARSYLIEKQVQNKDNRTFMSVFDTAKIAFKDIVAIQLGKYTSPKSFTIDELLAHKGKIFLLNNPKIATKQHSALTILLTAFMLEALSRPDLPEGSLRAAAIIDEALTFNLPANIENSIFSQCRSKGLGITVSAQWLPKRNEGQRGAWSLQSGHTFCMRVSDLETRSAFSQRIGSLRFEDEQTSESKGDKSSSTTTSTTERNYSALPPESFGTLKDREFILFHEKGVAPGVTKNVSGEQNNDIPVSIYNERNDIIDFLKLL